MSLFCICKRTFFIVGKTLAHQRVKGILINAESVPGGCVCDAETLGHRKVGKDYVTGKENKYYT